MTTHLPSERSAQAFIAELRLLASEAEQEKIQRYFKSGAGDYGEGDVFLGVRMGEVFALASRYTDMSLSQLEELLESPLHEARAGAVKIMAKQSGSKAASGQRQKELFDLFLRRIDRINNWDLVDLGAWDVIGRYLADKPRGILDELAGSDDLWERRTAILATLHFLRRGEVQDTVRLAALLLDDDQDLIHKAVGGVLREVGKHDRERLLQFLDAHAAAMPRTMLRYAMEHLDAQQRAHYRGVGPAAY
ncbi:DNA alkylation repair protein [Arthrobacter glacialis]|uniref:DNA alkylation repair protein n=1 Tax=Arthrobacter glacialis TaxID=1664 RepID=A0A2S3ZUE8_ARTGL|nr:DNA alkylation repair protein [Arthrobacter glacialis]POH58068.1 DNA alkylation repair protein [Arthrobacter glacialis]POH72724.1 DNA alkylation repair protein [Arthrobacter glacialis]